MLTDVSIKGLVYACFATLVLVVLLVLLRSFFKYLNRKTLNYLAETDWVINILRLKLLAADRAQKAVTWSIKFVHTLLVLLLIYLYIPLLLRLFPWTESLAQPFVDYFRNPITQSWQTIVTYVPSLMHIIVIIIFTWLILKSLKGVLIAIRAGYIILPGFYEEWSDPSYKILRFIILALALVMIFPLMPGADSPAFKGISLFVGAMVTLGSTGAMNNITAGIVLIYTRSFNQGDYVKIGDVFGQVIERSLLATRLQTTKHENVTIPNSTVLSSQVVNYSDTEDSSDIVVHASVGLGYDIDWRKVHELLISAARKIQYIEAEPGPYVLQKSLDDFNVSYEINAHIKRPDCLPGIYSELNRNILDEFNREKIEILSPHYTSVRDGNPLTVPEKDKQDK